MEGPRPGENPPPWGAKSGTTSINVAEDDEVEHYQAGHDKQPLLGPTKKVDAASPPADAPSLRGFDTGRVLKLAQTEWWLIMWATLSLAISGASSLAIPAIAGGVIDAVTSNAPDALQSLTRSVIILVVFFAIGSFFSFTRATLYAIAGERIVARLRKQVFNQIMRQDIAFFDKNKTGELMNRLSSDSSVIQSSLSVNISMGLRFTATVIGGIIILFVVSWRLTFVMLSILPVVIVAAMLYGKIIKELSKKVQDALASASDVAEESISNIRTVRSFSKEEYEMQRYADRIVSSYTLGVKKGFADGVFQGGTFFAASASICGVLWYGGYLVLQGSLSPGTLTSFILYTLTVAAAVGGLSSLYGDFMRAVGASQRIFELLDRAPDVKYEGGRRLDEVKGLIELKDIHFRYPSRPETEVLRGLSLALFPGKVAALVGPSGGGKSTVCHLIEAFYYVSGGVITVDSVDIRELDPQFLHDQISIVSQEPALFATTIRENIAYGMADVPLERIQEAAKKANAHNFISAFPDAYDTVVGERGVRLSGGQKQRVAIARALLKDPKILLLDEATSALDAESEHLVQQALDVLMQNRTVLVIAHRLSTVKNADRVYVINQGQVAEAGTHDELLAQNGLYKKLVLRQLSRDTS